MSQRTISNRKQKFNILQVKISTNPRVLKDLVDFYKTPLTKAVTLLNKKYRMTFQEIADKVFEGEIRRQAVQQNYTEGKK